MYKTEIDVQKTKNYTQKISLNTYLIDNTINHCDLFEALLYKEYWHDQHETEHTIFEATLDQLANAIRL